MDFQSFPKIPRLNRDVVITEKIDGTNAAVLISNLDETGELAPMPGQVHEIDGVRWYVQAQSRKRLITPGDDNFGFAGWVRDNATELVRLLGPGRHFGEWWGQGIQRGYGMTHKVFSLFNPSFHFGEVPGGSGLLHNEVRTVPVLYEGPFLDRDQYASLHLPHEEALWQLRNVGSDAAPGFLNPEGIIIFHTASRSLFKVTCKDDEKPKGSAE